MAGSQGIRAGRAYVEIGANDSRLVAGLKSAQMKLKMFGESATRIAGELKSVGGQLLGYGTALALPFAFATKIFANFDDQMRTVKAVTQATGQEFETLTETAKRLGRTTSFTASQVAGLMIELGRAGFKPDQIDVMTAAVLDLSRATGTEAAQSAGIVAAALRQFGLEASETTRVADGLTAATNKSFNTLESLGESLTYAGPVAADLNMSIEETLALLGALGNVGIQGSSAGTALRRLSIIGAAEAKKLKEIFGVDFLDTDGNMRPLVDSLDDVSKATAGLGNAARAAKFNEAFGLLGITSASAISKNAVGAKQLLQEIKAAGGIAADTAKQMDSGIGGSFRILISAVEGAALAIGEVLSPVLSTIAKRFTDVLGPITKWISENRSVVIAVVSVAAGLLTLGASLFAAGIAFTFVGIAFSGLSAALGLVASVIGTVFSLLFSLLTPVGLIVAGVVAIGTAFFTMTSIGRKAASAIGEYFSQLYGVVAQTFGAIASALAKGDIDAAAKIMWVSLKSVWLTGTSALTEIWLSFKHASIQTWFQIEAAYRTGIAGLTAAWQTFQNTLKTTGKGIGEQIASQWEKLQAGEELRVTRNRIQRAFEAGKITNDQKKEQRKAAQAKYNQRLEVNDVSTKAGLQSIERDSAAEQSRIDQDFENKTNAIDADLAAQMQANAEAYGTANAAVMKELEQAREAWRKAVAPDGSPAGDDSPSTSNGAGGVFDEVQKRLEEMIAGATAGTIEAGGSQTLGTFSAFEAALVGGGSLQQKQLTAMEKIERNTRRRNDVPRATP